LNRSAVRPVTGERRVGSGISADLHEGDMLPVTLALHNKSNRPLAHVSLEEHCSLAAPDSGRRDIALFIPALPPGQTVEFHYEVTADRRGLHAFPQLRLTSRAPLGFFQRKGTLDIPTRVLVYPEVRPLKRLDLLDRQPAALHTRPIGGPFQG